MSPDEIENLVTLLRKLEPGFFPLSVFNEMARLNVLTAIEVVPVRMVGASVHVLLLKRGVDDLFWKGLYHTPGTIVIASDQANTFADGLARIVKGELDNAPYLGSPVFVEVVNIQHERGRSNGIVYWLEMKDEHNSCGEYYDVDHLPPNIVTSQVAMIQSAAKKFKEYKTLSR